MRSSSPALASVALACVAIASAVPSASAQSLLDRSDNVSTDWIGNSGTIYFNFVHRFSVSPAPERKVTNFPTFLVATGLASRALVGVNYATNSDIAARYPNEYELFARYAPVQQEEGAPFDLGGQIDFNVAVKGVEAELSIARREGPARLFAVGRIVADTVGGSTRHLGLGGGGTLRFGRFIALAGDATTLTNRLPGETVAWSAGLHLALPNTPHTLSLHVSNATTSTLQGLSRGGNTKRWGFEFTVPVHLDRIFGGPAEVPSAPKPVASEERPSAGGVARDSVVARAPTHDSVVVAAPERDSVVATVRTSAAPTSADTTRARAPRGVAAVARAKAPSVFRARMKGSAYVPTRIEVDAGTTVQWKNLDAMIHTVTAVDRSFDSGVIAADGSYSRTFTKPGTYAVYCLAHPFMKATIVVK